MKQLKERTIPITLSRFGCYCFLILTAISWFGVYYSTQINTDVHEMLFGLYIVGGLMGTIFSIIFCSTEWDLNPVHAIGYCLRWKND